MDPVRSAEWLVQRLGPEAAGALRDALEPALAENQRPLFKAWLEEQPITDDAAGDFIRDAKADRWLPDGIGTWEALEAYLRSRDVDACVASDHNGSLPPEVLELRR